ADEEPGERRALAEAEDAVERPFGLEARDDRVARPPPSPVTAPRAADAGIVARSGALVRGRVPPPVVAGRERGRVDEDELGERLQRRDEAAHLAPERPCAAV